jgi:hypothetical protein
MNINVIDPGHKYILPALDGKTSQLLTFVKRDKNKNKIYSGTTCQFVLRALYDRVKYLHDELPHFVNPIILVCLKMAIWLFEFRAALRRGSLYLHTPQFATTSKMCDLCGHTDCTMHKK